MTKVAIGLGSNVGDRLANLRSAVNSLEGNILSVTDRSFVYETPPFGRTDQPCFLNAAILGTFDKDPVALLLLLKELERKIGRQDRGHWGPREIDLDILMIPDFRYKDENLEIPHRELAERAFVLIPLAEIAFDWVHPVLGIKIGLLAAKFEFEAQKFCRITRL